MNIEKITKLVNYLFESQELAHIHHLKADNNAKHLALGEYYEDIIEKIDILVEVIQGQYDIIDDYTLIENSDRKDKDITEYLTDLATYIIDNRFDILDEKKDAHIQALIDDVLITIYKAVYKLRFLN